jgi:hypothetical protein
MLAEVRSPIRRIRVAGKVSITWFLATGVKPGQAQNLDRHPAFIPNMTIVLLNWSKRLIYVNGMNTAPHCLVGPVS